MCQSIVALSLADAQIVPSLLEDPQSVQTGSESCGYD